MSRSRSLCRLTAAVLAATILAAVGVRDAEPVTPDYLAYVEFAPEDTEDQITLKQAYNQAAQRYNQALYDYLVTLEKHDWLVTLHNGSSDEAERRQARAEARPLRAELEDLRRAVKRQAAAVDQAARRAASAGVSVR